MKNGKSRTAHQDSRFSRSYEQPQTRMHMRTMEPPLLEEENPMPPSVAITTLLGNCLRSSINAILQSQAALSPPASRLCSAASVGLHFKGDPLLCGCRRELRLTAIHSVALLKPLPDEAGGRFVADIPAPKAS